MNMVKKINYSKPTKFSGLGLLVCYVKNALVRCVLERTQEFNCQNSWCQAEQQKPPKNFVVLLYLLFFLILLIFFVAFGLKNIAAQGPLPDVPGDPDQGTPPPPNGTGINPPGEHDWQCTNDNECNSGLCCVIGGSQPNKCHSITELHGGRCESTSESGGIPRGSHNWPCQNNSQCNQGLCCVKNGTMSNRCHPVWDSLHGGACMINNLLPNDYTPPNLPNNYIPPGNNNNSAGDINVSNSKKIIIIILIIFAVIAAAFAIWVFIYLRRKKIRKQVPQTPKTDEYKVNFVQGDGTQPARFAKR